MANDDPKEIPIFAPPKKRGMSLKEMYARDDASPHHKKWQGKTSAEVRADDAKRLKDAIRRYKARFS